MKKTKCCGKCRQNKELYAFSKDKARTDGLQCWCKSCRKACEQSPARKSARKKYWQSEKGKATLKKHAQSPIGKATRKGWLCSTLTGYLYNRWCNLKNRCNSLSNNDYPRYGGAGVKLLFKSFKEFFHHVTVDLGYDSIAKLKGLDIHRINNGHYEKGHIEFLSKKEHGIRHREINRKVA
jgi:hypothetical protein